MEREAWGRQVLEKHRLPIWQLLTVHENCRLSENLSNDNKKKTKDKYQTHSLGFVFITQSHGYCQNVEILIVSA